MSPKDRPWALSGRTGPARQHSSTFCPATRARRGGDIAGVMATEPKLRLLDEPSSGSAQAEAENLAPLLRRVIYETGCTLLIIEHDMPLITAVSDELIALERGRVVTRGL